MSRVPPAAPQNHGNTTAAWVTMIGLILATVLICAGLVTRMLWLSYVGVGLVGVSLLAGKALRAAGFGQPLSS